MVVHHHEPECFAKRLVCYIVTCKKDCFAIFRATVTVRDHVIKIIFAGAESGDGHAGGWHGQFKIIMAGAESGDGHAGGWHGQFNPCPEGSLPLRTEGDGNFGPRVAGSGFPGLPPLLCCDCFVAFAPGRAFLNRRALVSTVLASLPPCVRVGT